MQRSVQTTADGSQTIAIESMNVTYHSKHGAMQESEHVFIRAGLEYVLPQQQPEQLCIFEMGMGTGLNALLSYGAMQSYQMDTRYFAVEQFPLQEAEWQQLQYGALTGMPAVFEQIHTAPWNTDTMLSPGFTLHKHQGSLLQLPKLSGFHLVYFDAFAPTAQPELWTTAVFEQMFALLQPAGVLVTYCSKGDVRRAMLAAGFAVEKLQGPPGKREMLRALKPC